MALRCSLSRAGAAATAAASAPSGWLLRSICQQTGGAFASTAAAAAFPSSPSAAPSAAAAGAASDGLVFAEAPLDLLVDPSAPRVADRVVSVTAIDADGARHQIKGLAGKTLLETLIRNKLETSLRHPLEELESCNGNCEVTIANEWLDKLPPRSAGEEERLRQVSTTGKVGRSSRLGCQIVLDKALDGITVAQTEERPWYTL